MAEPISEKSFNNIKKIADIFNKQTAYDKKHPEYDETSIFALPVAKGQNVPQMIANNHDLTEAMGIVVIEKLGGFYIYSRSQDPRKSPVNWKNPHPKELAIHKNFSKALNKLVKLGRTGIGERVARNDGYDNRINQYITQINNLKSRMVI